MEKTRPEGVGGLTKKSRRRVEGVLTGCATRL